MEGEGMIEDVGGDGLTVSTNKTLVRRLMISCFLFLFPFSFGSMNGTTKLFGKLLCLLSKIRVPLILCAAH